MDRTIPRENLAVLSTGHIEQEELEHLKAAIKRGTVNGMTRAEGFMLYVQPNGDQFFPKLSYTLGHLKAHGFHWALFDCDGERLAELPYYHE